jgi:hypothetical protein
MGTFERPAPQRRPLLPTRRRAPYTYFVGRRADQAPEVYVVTDGDVQRIRAGSRRIPLALDWHAEDARSIELSRSVLTMVAGTEPARELAEEFARSVLAVLPEAGFVLEAWWVRGWLQQASEPLEATRSEPRRRSRLGRLVRLVPTKRLAQRTAK